MKTVEERIKESRREFYGNDLFGKVIVTVILILIVSIIVLGFTCPSLRENEGFRVFIVNK